MSDVDLAGTETAAPVAAIVATPQPESTADQAPQEGESPEAKPERTFTQKELDEIVQKRLARESRRAEKLAEAKARAEFAERQLAELKAPKVEKPSGKPTPQQFESYEDYMDALTDWKVDQRMDGIRKETELERTQRQMAETAGRVMPKLKSAMEKYDDFQDVATSFQAPRAAQAAMLESDITGELYYYLGSNPAELDRISSLSDVKQVLAIRELEQKLTAAPTPTKTPPPIVPNTGNAKVSKRPSEMNQEEFEEYRRKYRAKRR